MLENYKKMLKDSEMSSNFTETEDTINWYGEVVEVVKIFTPTDEAGNGVVATFHKGLETLISMDIVHVCTCGGHCKH